MFLIIFYNIHTYMFLIQPTAISKDSEVFLENKTHVIFNSFFSFSIQIVRIRQLHQMQMTAKLGWVFVFCSFFLNVSKLFVFSPAKFPKNVLFTTFCHYFIHEGGFIHKEVYIFESIFIKYSDSEEYNVDW